MDAYQFTADLVKSLVSLAWPAAFVIAVLIFRDKLKSLLPYLRLKKSISNQSCEKLVCRTSGSTISATHLPLLP